MNTPRSTSGVRTDPLTFKEESFIKVRGSVWTPEVLRRWFLFPFLSSENARQTVRVLHKWVRQDFVRQKVRENYDVANFSRGFPAFAFIRQRSNLERRTSARNTVTLAHFPPWNQAFPRTHRLVGSCTSFSMFYGVSWHDSPDAMVLKYKLSIEM